VVLCSCPAERHQERLMVSQDTDLVGCAPRRAPPRREVKRRAMWKITN
jgi:hypothetical protein